MAHVPTVGRLLVLAPALALGGCGLVRGPVLDPDGPVSLAQRNLLLIDIGLMLIVIVPVFVLAFWFPRRFRAGNARSRYWPDWTYSARLDAVIWLVPAAIVAVLGYFVWSYSHALDPYAPVGSAPPLEVQAVAQDWKWLFIYPEENIAVVNELVFPSRRPLKLVLTSDTVMNALYIPGLGGQIFAMAGMRTALNLKADAPGDFVGRNMQYSGRGFADQHFAVHATTDADFAAWVARAKKATTTLDETRYQALAEPSDNAPVVYFSAVEPHLFADIIAKYVGHADTGRADTGRADMGRAGDR